MSSPLPDAAPRNWVDRYAPERLKPWLQLGRFDRPVGIWLLMLPGWWGVALASAQAERWPDPWLLFLFFVGAAVMRAAGCAYNDAVDRDLDRKVARTAARPVASGRISRRAAVAYAVGLSLIGLLVLVQMDRLAIVVGAAAVLLVAAYPFMKRITWWPQAWLGLTFNWGALVGVAAAYPGAATAYREQMVQRTSEMLLTMPESLRGSLDMYAVDTSAHVYIPLALLLYAAGVFWTLGYDTIYAVQDLEDDALAGVKSSARRLGDRTQIAVGLFYTAASGLVLIAGNQLGPAFVLGWLLFSAHLAWQATRLRVQDPQLALGLFKSNAWAGLILFAALALGALRP